MPMELTAILTKTKREYLYLSSKELGTSRHKAITKKREKESGHEKQFLDETIKD
jgi:hypothetical protein